LDRRLLPLFETLVRADLDWLAQEIVAGALAGQVLEESPEQLQAARSAVFREKQDVGVREVELSVEADAEPLEGDEQIAWAATHVSDRLEQLLKMTSLSIARVDAIVEGDPGERAFASDGEGTVLVLEDGDRSTKVDARGVAAASEAIDALRAALEAWSVDARRAGEPA
jgi:hypothetical protein